MLKTATVYCKIRHTNLDRSSEEVFSCPFIQCRLSHSLGHSLFQMGSEQYQNNNSTLGSAKSSQYIMRLMRHLAEDRALQDKVKRMHA